MATVDRFLVFTCADPLFYIGDVAAGGGGMQAAIGAQFSFGRGDLGGRGQGGQEREEQRDKDMHGHERLRPPTAREHSTDASTHQSGGSVPRTCWSWSPN